MGVLARKLQNTKRQARVIEQLRQQDQSSYCAIFEKAFEAMVVVNEIGLILSANEAANTLLRFCDSELIGHDLGVMFPESVLGGSRYDSILELARRQKSGTPTSVKLVCKDGSLKAAEITVVEAFRSGVKVFVFILRDLSHQRQFEMAQLELKAKAEFIAAITHEARVLCLRVSHLG
jgi:PAS domain S-box-containing protein